MTAQSQRTHRTQLLTMLVDDARKTAELVQRVVRKYPYESLPPALQPFHRAFKTVALRPSSHDDTVLLLLADMFNSRQARIPGAWLDLPDRELAKAVRTLLREHEVSTRKRRLADHDRRMKETERLLTVYQNMLTEMQNQRKNMLARLNEADGASAATSASAATPE